MVNLVEEDRHEDVWNLEIYGASYFVLLEVYSLEAFLKQLF
jgi:hypothetical protein